MKLAALLESTTRLDIVEEGDWKQRVFFTASLKIEHQDWLHKAGASPKIGEATLDINKDQTAYLNRIDVFAKGEGYGAEIIKHIKAEAKAKGITSIKAYIEHLNSASKSMIRKAGFTEAKEEKHGSYWVVTL